MKKLLLSICFVFILNVQADSNESLMLDDQLNISRNTWVESVITKIHTYWRYSGARSDWSCYVFITQDRNGNVKTVDVDNCGDSIMNIDANPKLNSFKNSIEKAVYKASPLPIAPDDAVFSKELYFVFTVK